MIPDERDVIEATLRELADEKGCCLVVTTGGTGPAPRDVTPEATEAVCGRMMPGYGEQMRAISLRHVPTAVLSRQTAGLRGKTLILNLPGKPKAIDETLPEVFVSIPACIDLMEGPYIATNDAVCPAFRPCTLKRTAKPSAGVSNALSPVATLLWSALDTTLPLLNAQVAAAPPLPRQEALLPPRHAQDAPLLTPQPPSLRRMARGRRERGDAPRGAA